ncbi:MAG: hypothetical protein NVS3B14_07080 [Ktedonobacteraceae bacterium]
MGKDKDMGSPDMRHKAGRLAARKHTPGTKETEPQKWDSLRPVADTPHPAAGNSAWADNLCLAPDSPYRLDKNWDWVVGAEGKAQRMDMDRQVKRTSHARERKPADQCRYSSYCLPVLPASPHLGF